MSELRKSDFYYDLPKELIAQHPLKDRTASRLLHLDRKTGKCAHLHFRDVKAYLKPGKKGSDPAAVAYDAVEHARAQGKELVLIDTAGRMQTNTNLMDEMKKIKRVANPDLVIFVGDAITGNDATEQARKFNEAIDIDGVILTKADADSKGGASLSIGYVIKKPIMFLGVGQGYDDIMEYDPEWMLNQLFSENEEVADEA